MKEYYTYIYYDTDWVAYYVGKGRRNRRRVKREIEVPPNERIQVFHFDEEWKAYECEIELISFYGRIQDGGTLSNVSTGGPGCPGVIPNEETRAKRSRALKGRIFTPAHRAKLSAAAKGRVVPEDTRKAASRAHRDKPKSVEHRAKISQALIGNKNGVRGNPTPVTLVELSSDILKTFCSGKQAAIFIGCCEDSITKLKRGYLKTIKGWKLHD